MGDNVSCEEWNYRKYEELSMNAWPSFHTILYDGWVLRFTDGYTRRSNSITPIYESTIPLEQKIDFCEEEYGRHQLPVIFKIAEQSTPAGIDAVLEQRGYSREFETALRVLDLNEFSRPENISANIETHFSMEWLEGFYSCSDIQDEQTRITVKKILDRILGDVICVSKKVEGKVVGCGYGAVQGDCVGIFDIVVHSDHRGRGYGLNIMTGILETAAERNLKTAYLQVMAGNKIAENLYDKLGFKEAYKYWYRRFAGSNNLRRESKKPESEGFTVLSKE